MRILIDTHTFIWFIGDPDRLGNTTRQMIEERAAAVSISIASIWEISIKTSSGRLTVAGGFHAVEGVLRENDIEILPIEFAHTLKQNRLPFYHRDPFDRMIAAQALVEEIDLISRDDVFDLYFEGSEVKRIW